jgi:hypothetical protein
MEAGVHSRAIVRMKMPDEDLKTPVFFRDRPVIAEVLALGSIESLALAGCTYKAAFTPGCAAVCQSA